MANWTGEVGEEENSRNMRLLFLHGYSQNGDVLRARTGALRKALKNDEIDREGDHTRLIRVLRILQGALTNHVYIRQVSNPRAWFLEPPKSATVPTDGTEGGRPITDNTEGETRSTYDGWLSSLEYLSSFFQEQPPFDGILGFSQGATFAAIISTIVSRPPEDQPSCFQKKVSGDDGITSPVHPPFRFSILVSAFLPRDARIFEYVPSASIDDSTRSNAQSTDFLFVVAEKDVLIAPERTTDLMRTRYFETLKNQDENSVRLLTHAGGHLIPTDAINRQVIVDFIVQHGMKSSL